MEFVNLYPDTPEGNLALDELLLDKAERGEMGESLRFWEPDQYFVVLGRACKVSREVNVEKCRKDGVKVLRRASGGGTVLQGKGCVNYSLVLSYGRSPEMKTISSCYEKILGDISSAICGEEQFEVLPLCDIAFRGKKFSGNAQCRKKRYFLHHGTILLDLDIDKIEKYLKHPPKEPEYRQGRKHGDFLANINKSRDVLENAIKGVFSGADALVWEPHKRFTQDLERLVRKKYSRDEWNLAF